MHWIQGRYDYLHLVGEQTEDQNDLKEPKDIVVGSIISPTPEISTC